MFLIRFRFSLCLQNLCLQSFWYSLRFYVIISFIIHYILYIVDFLLYTIHYLLYIYLFYLFILFIIYINIYLLSFAKGLLGLEF